MKVKTLSALAGLGGALIMSTTAQAAFTGFSYESQVGPSGRTVWRVYATFNDAANGISSIGAINTNMTIQTYAGTVGNEANSGQFFSGAPGLPPFQSEIDNSPNAAFRSFYTINLTTQDQNPNSTLYPLVAVGMPTFTGNNVTAAADTAALTTTPDAPYASAAWAGGPLRVLILQLQVTAGNQVRGTIGMNVLGPTDAVVVGTFNSAPAPGALALLGLAGLVGGRRRRA